MGPSEQGTHVSGKHWLGTTTEYPYYYCYYTFFDYRKETFADDNAELRDFKERFLKGTHVCL